MIIRIDDLIEKADINEDLKTILKIIVSAANSLSDNYDRKRTDVVIKDPSKGIVFNVGNRYFRARLIPDSTDHATAAWRIENLGTKEPIINSIEGDPNV